MNREKIVFISLAMMASVASAQTYSRIQAGYYMAEICEPETDTDVPGYGVGYLMGFQMGQTPFYIESGAMLSWHHDKEDFLLPSWDSYPSHDAQAPSEGTKLHVTLNNIDITLPVNLVWRADLGQDLSLAPFVGVGLKYNLWGKMKTESGDSQGSEYSLYDHQVGSWHRTQLVSQLGASVNYQHWQLATGYAFGITELGDDMNVSGFFGTIGYTF